MPANIALSDLVPVFVLQIELANVKKEKIPAGWGADASGRVRQWKGTCFLICLGIVSYEFHS